MSQRQHTAYIYDHIIMQMLKMWNQEQHTDKRAEEHTAPVHWLHTPILLEDISSFSPLVILVE